MDCFHKFGERTESNQQRACLLAQSLQSCPILCDPMDCSPPGCSVHGILQARILEQVAISSSRGSPNSGIETWSPVLQVDSLLSEAPGKPPKQPIASKSKELLLENFIIRKIRSRRNFLSETYF